MLLLVLVTGRGPNSSIEDLICISLLRLSLLSLTFLSSCPPPFLSPLLSLFTIVPLPLCPPFLRSSRRIRVTVQAAWASLCTPWSDSYPRPLHTLYHSVHNQCTPCDPTPNPLHAHCSASSLCCTPTRRRITLVCTHSVCTKTHLCGSDASPFLCTLIQLLYARVLSRHLLCSPPLSCMFFTNGSLVAWSFTKQLGLFPYQRWGCGYLRAYQITVEGGVLNFFRNALLIDRIPLPRPVTGMSLLRSLCRSLFRPVSLFLLSSRSLSPLPFQNPSSLRSSVFLRPASQP